MSKISVKSAISALLISALALSSIPASAAGTVSRTELYTNRRELFDGLYFTNTVYSNASRKRVEEYTLEVMPGGQVYPIVLAKDRVHDPMDVNAMTAWAESQGLNVHAAINADFFYESNGYPLGGVIQDGRYISSLNGESLLCFTDDGAFFCEKPQILLTLENHGGGDSGSSNAGKTIEVEHLNKVRTPTGGLFLYTSAYDSSSTCTTRPGWGVRFRILSGDVTVDGSVELEVVDVVPQGVNYDLDDSHIVLTAPADNPKYAEYYSNFSVGDTVTLTTAASDPRLTDVRWACGCGDLLADGGKLTDKAGWDRDLIGINPRTCVGIKPDGSIVARVVDGRRGDYSNGALLEDVAADLVAMGCQSVVNLDGGGSSVMSVRLPGSDRCAIVNKPSGKPRNCGDYILFVSDAKPDGVASVLHLEEDGAFVLTGSTMPVNIAATDSAGMPVEFTGSFFADCDLGTLDEGLYTAGDRAGVDGLRLYAYTSLAEGRGNIHVIDRLDTLTVVDAATGQAPALSELEVGDEIQLSVSGTYLTRDVAISTASVSFSASEGLGEITPDGLFTFTGEPGMEGEITVSAGGVEVPLSVRSRPHFKDTAGHWAQEYIDELLYRGIVEGTGDMIYRPDDNIGRCDFVLMLWRALGKTVLDPAGEEQAFSDVDAESYYYDAVTWAARAKIVNGVGGDRFDPRGELTREQSFTIIYRLLTNMNKELPEPGPEALEAFSDSDSVSDYARDAMASLTAFGMISGDGGSCHPLRSITRAEVAKIIVTALYGQM